MQWSINQDCDFFIIEPPPKQHPIQGHGTALDEKCDLTVYAAVEDGKPVIRLSGNIVEDEVSLNREQALSLLDWLLQEKPFLEEAKLL